MRGGALASSSTDHGEGRTGAWRLEVWSSRGLGMGRPAVLGALGGGAAGERERDRGRRRWPAAMASTPRSLTPERIRTDPAATARESARGGRNRAPRHVRRRVPQPPCAAARGSAPLVLPAGRSPLAVTPPHVRGPPRRGCSAPPRRHGGERGLRAVATSGGLATSVRVVVGVAGAGGDGARERGRQERPPKAGGGSGGATVGIEREKGERAGRARGRLRDGTESRVNIWADWNLGFVRVFGYRAPKPDLPEIISGTVTYYPK